jgi:hypothetical protein
MFQKTLLILSLTAACTAVHAQSTPASSPAKKDLVNRILKIQQPGIEQMARELVRQPAGELLASASEYLQTQVPADKRDAIGKALQQDADKYMNETYPLVRDQAIRLAPSTVGALLEEKFTEDELKQAVAMMESPVYVKFQGMGAEMQRVLVAKLVPEVKPQVGPRLRVLDESIARRLGVQPTGGGTVGNAPAAAAPAAKAPAKK